MTGIYWRRDDKMLIYYSISVSFQVQATHVTGHHTRTGPISGTVNSDIKRYSFKFCVYNYLNTSTHNFFDL